MARGLPEPREDEGGRRLVRMLTTALTIALTILAGEIIIIIIIICNILNTSKIMITNETLLQQQRLFLFSLIPLVIRCFLSDLTLKED